ncbi:DUF1232 domain-containing protein [Phytohabitans rumicis]|uniref:DUF1232 domain-containing protein n=1 Tax=Phytohabitans rumicis TaxID=1076125 RepID=A0A6V8L4R3_9ACTN|nr:DUF1232 domain-containing protein [Phytohabitans rumicis]GFJ89609.1 hypothetical protein Prum_032510 [Phytohabitans rumicis]
MGRTLNRTAAFTALGRALTGGVRGGPPLGRRLVALPRMLWATMTGKYDGGVRLALMAAATAYVVSPIDAWPEAIFLAVGLVDDLVVVTWLAGAVLAETERFLEWEATQRSVIPGHVI